MFFCIFRPSWKPHNGKKTWCLFLPFLLDALWAKLHTIGKGMMPSSLCYWTSYLNYSSWSCSLLLITRVGDDALIAIGQGCSLNHLNVSGCHQIGDAGIIAIARGCPELSYLDVSVLQVCSLSFSVSCV